MSRDHWRRTTADHLRTGDTFTHDYVAHRGWHLTVDIVHRERFTSPETGTIDVIRFTGTDNWGVHHDRGWALKPVSRVYVLMEAPLKGDVAGSGVFGAVDADDTDLDEAGGEAFADPGLDGTYLL